MVRATLRPRPPPPNAALIATGQAVLLGEGDDLAGPETGSGVPGTSGAPARWAMCRAATLSPRSRIACRRRADPGQPGVQHGLGELGVLGQEPVAGVDRVGAGLGGGGEDLADVAGSSRPGCHRPARTPRRPPGRAARPGRARRTPPRWPCPASRQARATRTAISPRLAIRTFVMRASCSPLLLSARQGGSAPGRRAGAAQRVPAGGPVRPAGMRRRDRRALSRVRREGYQQRADQGRQLSLGRSAALHWRRAGAAGGVGGHNGMLPCFLGGSVSRLVRRLMSARVTATRVSAGRITASR